MHIVRNAESHPPIPIGPPCTLIVCARVIRQHHESSYALVLHKQPVDNEWQEGENANTASTHTHTQEAGVTHRKASGQSSLDIHCHSICVGMGNPRAVHLRVGLLPCG